MTVYMTVYLTVYMVYIYDSVHGLVLYKNCYTVFCPVPFNGALYCAACYIYFHSPGCVACGTLWAVFDF